MKDLTGRKIAEYATGYVFTTNGTVTGISKTDPEQEVPVEVVGDEPVYAGFTYVEGIPYVVYAFTPGAKVRFA